MSLGREFKACLFSVFVFAPASVGAEESTGTTTIYFHDVPVEEVFDDDLIGLLYSIEEFNDGDLEELLERLDELYEQLENESLSPEEIEAIEGEIEEIYNSFIGYERLDLGNIIDENPPTKTNDSEYPPTLRKFIDLFFGGDLKTFIKSLLSGEEFDEDTLIEFEMLIEDMLSSLASFRGFYLYNGDESISLNGEVTFDLYFSSPLNYILDSDTANISFVVYDVDLLEGIMEPKFTESESIVIKRQLLNPLKNPVEYEILITVNTDLEPGDIIMVDLDIVAGEKHLLDYLDIDLSELGLNETFEALAELINSTGIEELAPLSDLLLNLSELLAENFSTENITAILEELTSSFIYDSVSHPSSLTLPEPLGSGDEENIKRYYLHGDNVMDETPADGDTKEVNLKNVAKWDSPALGRSKVIKDATASLYIDHQDLFRFLNFIKGPIKVTASLLHEGEEIGSSTEEFGKTTIINMFTEPSEATTFSFSNINREIIYGDNLGLDVYVSNGTKFGILDFRRNVKLLYGSSDFPSSLIIKFDETDNIIINCNQSDKIVALSESVEYNLTVTSEFAEDITMAVYDFSTNEQNKWDIDIVPESFSIDAGGQETVIVTVTSKDDDLDAYVREDQLRVTFAAEGKTGKGLFEAEVEISKDAIEYDVDIIAPKDKEIKYGTSKTYQFEIRNNNTGFWPDSYTIEATSKHDWDIDTNYSEDKLEDLDPYVINEDSVVVNVTVHVPKDVDVSSDKLTFKVISDASDKVVMVNVTTTVIGPNILEALYDFFESAADGIGLTDAFGSPSLGAIFLASIVFIIIFFIVIIIVYFLMIKYVNLVCLERIKDISPDEEATFEITVQNPYKYPMTYEVSAKEASSSEGWDVSLDTENIALESKQSKTVIMVVKPTSFVKPDDWAEVVVTAKAVEKQKSAEITTVTTIKDGNTELKISGVFHWPRVFKKGDKVTTSFKLYNKGNTSASNISVILYVNGKEKNKVEDITIPRDGYADIEIPWIAGKGKNEVNIVVK
jgi:hypothetical protein